MTTNDAPYRHKEPTILIELEVSYAEQLLKFWEQVRDQERHLHVHFVPVNVSLNSAWIAPDFLQEKYGSYWDLYCNDIDLQPLLDALEKR
jgi:hypothetical protein